LPETQSLFLEEEVLVELTIIPAKSDINCTAQILKVVRNTEGSHKAYPLSPKVVCIDGEWDEVMALVRLCHDKIREQCTHVRTKIDIIDEGTIQ